MSSVEAEPTDAESSNRSADQPATAPHPLDNAGWYALTGVHADFAQGTGSARRYDPEVSVFSAIEDDSKAAWHDLATLTGPGGTAVLFRALEVVAPAGWMVTFGGRGHQMVLAGDPPDLAVPSAVRPLGSDDVPQMLALVELTQPGPFRPRTNELGGYVGIFEGDTLMAMAGQRISIDGFTEISAVCTHPNARRRGYAAVVTTEVSRALLRTGVTPFLHVAETNIGALRVYERLGFATRVLTNFVGVKRTE